MSNPIPAENDQYGTVFRFNNFATTQIAAYADKTSYNQGDTVNFRVSTQVSSTAYSMTIYRLGWYRGMGANQKAQVTGRSGVAQGYWDGVTLQNCPTAIIDASTHLLECGWAVTDTWTIPGNAVRGLYLALFTDANGFQYFCPFVVKDGAAADYVFINSTSTSEAYNTWGGYSLYTNQTVGVKVGHNRPDVNGGGTGNIFRFDLGFIHWLEAQGYNLAYLTPEDIQANTAILDSFGAVLHGGHDEYWTKERRDATEAAITHGVGMGFCGANASYWQMRYEADAASHANRTITCYKVTTGAANLALDPFYGVDNTRVTTQWRDAVLNRPENSMMGVMYSALLNGNSNVPWTVDSGAGANAYIKAAGMVAGQSYGSDLVGYECDRIWSNGHSPAGLTTLATTPVTVQGNGNDTQNSTVYTAPSGAVVFAAGSIGLIMGLDTYRDSFQAAPRVVQEVRALFAALLPALLQGKAGATPSGASQFSVHA